MSFKPYELFYFLCLPLQLWNYLTLILFRSIDLQEVIGGIGGYIGALLGYSILQIPELLILIMSKIKWIMKTMQINKNSNKKFNETQSSPRPDKELQ